MKEKILVSACLIGEKCRYDGKDNLCQDLLKLTKYFDLIPICPEVSGGLKIPRVPAEIQGNRVVTERFRCHIKLSRWRLLGKLDCLDVQN